MNEQSSQNKKAWEYRAYEFWNKRDGTPETKAKIILENPELQLKTYRVLSKHQRKKDSQFVWIKWQESSSVSDNRCCSHCV